MKRNQETLDSIWRKALVEINLKATRIVSNLYLGRVKVARRAFFADRISEADNQQAELFCIVQIYPELATVIGLPLEFPVTNLRHFKNLKRRPFTGTLILFYRQ